KHVVAFAPPAILVLQDGHRDTGEMAAACGFEPDVVILAIEIFAIVHLGISVGGPIGGPAFRGCLLAVLGMEIKGVGRKRLRASAIVDIEIERMNPFLAFVGDGNAGALLKWHWEKGVEGFVCGHGKRNRLVKKILTETQAEKVADRRFDTWTRFPIPVDTQYEFFQMELFRRGDSDPNVGDYAWARYIEKIKVCTSRNRAKVGVSAGAVVAGGALLDVIVGLGQGEQRFGVTGTALCEKR